MPFPTKDADFNDYVNIAIPYLNVPANKSRLVISAVAQADLTQVTASLGSGTPAPAGSWNDIYPKSQNPATDSTTLTKSKTTLRGQIEAFLRVIYKDIPQSALIQTDRDTLNLQARDAHTTPAQVPANAPTIAIVQRDHLSATISITDPAHPSTQAKPDGVNQTEIESAFQPKVVAAPAPAAPAVAFPQESDFKHIASTGRFLYKRAYTQDQIGGTDFIRARYVNTRKEPGPWSEIISVMVS